jgi:nitrogen regulatory protein PII
MDALGTDLITASRGENRVKMIITMVHPTKLDPIHEALESIEVARMTVADASGYDDDEDELLLGPFVDTIAPPPHTEGGTKKHLARKIEIRVVVNDDFLERTLQVIEKVGKTGRGSEGDGKILVIPVLEAIRTDDCKRGPGAV